MSTGSSTNHDPTNTKITLTRNNDAGRPPTDEELREAGIDPEDNHQSGSGELPDVLD